jgi:preprotein translocase subunit SecA
MAGPVSAPVRAPVWVPPPALPPARRLVEGADRLGEWVRGRLRRAPHHARRLRALAQDCARVGQTLSELDDAELQARLSAARQAVRCDPLQAQGDLAGALALVGEAAARTLGMRPYPVQFMGALALHQGWLAEMATGEGKTLTASLAAVLAGWSGRPCHVVTSNDYLAERDARHMAVLYARCGLSAASVVAGLEPQHRPARYSADVVYVTAKELLADHLRDELAARAGRDPRRIALRHWLGTSAAPSAPTCLLVRGLHTAIVDEADNVLIDEAVTPLILSAPRESLGLADAVRAVSALADTLQSDRHYEVLQRQRTVQLRDEGRAALRTLAPSLPALWRPEPRCEELLRQALTVRHFILRDHQYVIDDGKIVLLDEFTGRLTPGRSLTAGLHQAVEAREGLELTDPTESLGQMSFQTFFRRLPRLAGTTGTGREAADEFWRIYGLGVMPIPTHRPRQTVVQPVQMFETEAAKWSAVVDLVARLHAQGCPVLVGVRSVQASRQLAERLQARGLRFELLNAVLHDQEAAIVARAGEIGGITIATNMAGRGTDIALGPGVPERGGLNVLIVESNESARIDRQLAGRCGRQGDPGCVWTVLSLEDGLPRRFLPRALRAAAAPLLQGGIARADAVARALVRTAQRRAEADAYARRRSVLKNDDWLDEALPFAAGATPGREAPTVGARPTAAPRVPKVGAPSGRSPQAS